MHSLNLVSAVSPSKRMLVLEYLRGLLSLWVLLDHGLHLSGISVVPNYLGIIKQSGRAVEVFIIISGFVIYNLINTVPQTWGQFITRRLFRIYPVYIISLSLGVVAFCINTDTLNCIPFDSSFLKQREFKRLFDEKSYFLWHLVSHVFLIHGMVPSFFLPNSNAAILPTSWSLSLEFQFYCLAPFLFRIFNRSLLSASILIFAVLVLYKICSPMPFFDPGSFIFQVLPLFIFGMLFGLAFSKLNKKRLAVLMSVAFFTSFLAFFCRELIHFRMLEVLLNKYGLAVNIFIILLTLVVFFGSVYIGLFKRLGDVSYLVFILHCHFMIIGLWSTKYLWVGWDSLKIFTFIMVPIMLLIVLVISPLSFGLIEVRWIAKGRALS